MEVSEFSLGCMKLIANLPLFFGWKLTPKSFPPRTAALKRRRIKATGTRI